METFTVHLINVKILPCARNPCVFKTAFSKMSGFVKSSPKIYRRGDSGFAS